MTFFLFLAVVGLGIWVANLSNRLSDLERGPARVPQKNTSFRKTEKAPTELPWERVQTVSRKTASKAKAVKSEPFHLEAFLGEKLFPILGAASMVLAIGFFTVWAFANGWVGPMGRIALGVAFSIALVALGEFTRKKYPQFFQYFTAIGIAGLIITTFVARYNYEFITPIQSLLLYSLEAGAGVFFSLRYNSRILGNFSVLSGLVAPLLTNTNEPNVLGLLAFLTIISAAGFIMAAYKKWPEIFAVLIIFIIGFEFLSIEAFKDNQLLISPLVLLGFIFGLHTLVGAGGIVRLIRENQSQSIEKINTQDTYEIIIFTASLLTANLLAFNVFEYLDWKNFGFIVVAQALILYALAEWFRSKKWEIFHWTALSSSLTFILFATFWELKAQEAFILTLVLIAEGVTLCFVGQKSSQKIFEIFGKIALTLAFFWTFNIEEFWASTICILALVGAFLYSANSTKTNEEKVWLVAGFGMSTILIGYWSLEFLKDELPRSLEFLTLLPMGIWGIALSYSVLWTRSELSRILGAAALFITNMIGIGLLEHGPFIMAAISTALLLIFNFGSLAAFFLEDKNLPKNSTIQYIAVYATLIISSFIILFFGAESLDEPSRSIFWICWAALLLGIGFAQRWPRFRYVGLGFMSLVILKLYFIDIWQWEVWVRFLAFFALGVALLGVGFFYQKLWSKK